MERIVSAIFRSVWDDGITIETPCKVDLDTREVFDIEVADVDGLDNLESEAVIIDGEEYPVFQREDIDEDDNEYWYD